MVSFSAKAGIENALFKNYVVPSIHSFEGALPRCQPLYIHDRFDILTSSVSNINILDITTKEAQLFLVQGRHSKLRQVGTQIKCRITTSSYYK
jgi:hypothetical protein